MKEKSLHSTKISLDLLLPHAHISQVHLTGCWVKTWHQNQMLWTVLKWIRTARENHWTGIAATNWKVTRVHQQPWTLLHLVAASDINTIAAHWIFIPYWIVLSHNLEMLVMCRWKSQKDSADLEPVWNHQPPSPCWKSLQSSSFLILMLAMNFSKSSSPHLHACMRWLPAMRFTG